MHEAIAELRARKSYAALLMTYRCTIACEHCCFSCSPTKPDVVMGVDEAVEHLRGLHELGRMVHIAGGEPFLHYDRLIAIVRAAAEVGAAPHFVETNASWCVSEEVAHKRLGELRAAGVRWLLVSTDRYHLRHVPFERILRCLHVAEEVFGTGTTMGLAADADIARSAAMVRDDRAFIQSVREDPPVLIGRAKACLSGFAVPKPLVELQLDSGWGLDPNSTCKADWDPCWEIHVDPYGNVQTNCGILLGTANDEPVSDIARTWHMRNPILEAFSRGGVAWLLEEGRAHGFVPADAYPQKCLLCAELRTFLRGHSPEYREVFGPDEVYAE